MTLLMQSPGAISKLVMSVERAIHLSAPDVLFRGDLSAWEGQVLNTPSTA